MNVLAMVEDQTAQFGTGHLSLDEMWENIEANLERMQDPSDEMPALDLHNRISDYIIDPLLESCTCGSR